MYLYGPSNPYGVEEAYDDDSGSGFQQPKIKYYATETGSYYLRVAHYANTSSHNKQNDIDLYSCYA